MFLALVSIPLWVIFEGYNLLIENWHYINLPENLVVRYFGYAWAFATISPGIFLTAEVVAILRPSTRARGALSSVEGRGSRSSTVDSRPSTLDYVLVGAGAAMLVWPIVRPSPYLAAPVFLGFVFLLDPLNARAGDESLLRDIRKGDYSRLINLLIAGFICGGLWEFWNYWSRAKWIYTVPDCRRHQNLRNARPRLFWLSAVRTGMFRHVYFCPAPVLAWISAMPNR